MKHEGSWQLKVNPNALAVNLHTEWVTCNNNKCISTASAFCWVITVIVSLRKTWKTQSLWRIPKSSPLLPILSQLNQVQATSYLLKYHFNIILLSRSLCLPCCPVLSVISAKPCVLFSFRMYVTCPARVVTGSSLRNVTVLLLLPPC